MLLQYVMIIWYKFPCVRKQSPTLAIKQIAAGDSWGRQQGVTRHKKEGKLNPYHFVAYRLMIRWRNSCLQQQRWNCESNQRDGDERQCLMGWKGYILRVLEKRTKGFVLFYFNGCLLLFECQLLIGKGSVGTNENGCNLFSVAHALYCSGDALSSF